ncbi:CaiB/BaiF CoA transferase family protein [Vallicoccus soli]|uniref:CaiB/BaiF CoA transferase family protein n=1 Tax=Vallicoccus soli TaxID=2339232 RepID=UPI001403750C|nr:CaiB/BaiF CoA-transferase family protein [Vallicoccus soli]
MSERRRLPLEGLTVVAVEQAVAAPLATRHLADLGARVIKVERPGRGDFARDYDTTVLGQSSHFVWLNRSKESIALDLKSEDGLRTFERLLARADVLVQNLAPGALDRMGLTAAALRERFPRLVAVGISGYGTSGPYRDKKAYDLLVQCEAGVVALTGTPDAPSKTGIPVADIAAGMYAYAGVLAALVERSTTGEGQVVEVSMLDALVEWAGYALYFTGYGGAQPPRSGAHHAAIAPYGPHRAGDGHQVFLGVQNDREWRAFCALVLEEPDLADDPRFATNSDRVAHRDELTAATERAFAGLTADEVVERLERARVANARLRDVAEVLGHPQLAARDRWREVATPAGPVRALRPPTVSDREARMDPVPAVGEHTAQVLAWLDAQDGAG